MLQVKSTPNEAGVTIYGDFADFEALYEALHHIVGEEEEWHSYGGAALRVLGLCYDIRHALMGNRDITFVENGMDHDKMKYLGVITSDKNVYLAVQVLWPEMIFIMMALNDFLKDYANKKVRYSYNAFVDKNNVWDPAIAHTRLLQAAFQKHLRSMLAEAAFSRAMNLMIQDYSWAGGYAAQYVDVLNCRFLKLSKEKRLKNITIMIKRLAEQGDEYKELKQEVQQAARRLGCAVHNIRLTGVEYPEEIDW